MYRQTTLGDVSEHYLEIDNLNRAEDKTCKRPVTVASKDAEEIVYREVKLLRRACLQLKVMKND